MQTLSNPRFREPETPRYITLMVALYFVLLAFFIVLVSRSNFDPPTEEPVMASLQAQFREQQRGKTLNATPTPAAAPAYAAWLKTFQQIFPELQDAQWQPSPDPSRIEAEVAASNLLPDADGLLPIQQEKLAQIAALWQQPNPPKQLAIFSRWPGDSNADARTNQQLGELARGLQAKGMPARALTIGLDEHLSPGRLKLQLTLPDTEAP